MNKTLKYDVIKQLGVSMIINPKCNVQLGFLRHIMMKIHKLRMRGFRGWNIEFNKEVEQKKKRHREQLPYSHNNTKTHTLLTWHYPP